ncbi:MAG: dihydroneopterin aldolase [Victivallales bacterium]|nr:dihydroneopterin aldolase [Victivallales bacterium]
MDSILLRDLTVSCILGCDPEERTRRRLVKITIELVLDLNEAATTDNLEKTVDYGMLVKKIIEFAEGTSYHLIEALAGAVADFCLEDPKVQRVDLQVTKPLPCPGLNAAAIRISRERKQRPVEN